MKISHVRSFEVRADAVVINIACSSAQNLPVLDQIPLAEIGKVKKKVLPLPI